MKLIVITRGYPINTEELSFLKQELEVLDKSFSIIMIPKFSVVELDESEIKYPTVKCNCNTSFYMKLFYAVKGIFDIRLWKEIINHLRNHKLTIVLLKQIISDVALSKQLDTILTKVVRTIDNNERIIIYSYWFDYGLLSAVKIKRDNIKIITRTHGFDLYNERCKSGIQVFKEQLDKDIDRVSFISQYGKNYYCINFATENPDSNKYCINYLGVKEQAFQQYVHSDKLYLVSCSSVISIKRIDTIIKGLAGIDNFEIEWTHIGGGPMLEDIKSFAKELLSQKRNISYVFTGNILSDEVIRIYREQYFDSFILISETEGLPVSIMEAMSFGIPVIANDVGGVQEIVDSTNGFLIDSYCDGTAVSKVLSDLFYLNEKDKEELRKNAYKTWTEKFNSRKNAKEFSNMLNGLFQ